MRYGAYRELRRSLQRETSAAKDRAWSNLAETVESDPRGRPYKVVTRKLRAKGSPATTEMEPTSLAKVIGTLFRSQENAALEHSRESTLTTE